MSERLFAVIFLYKDSKLVAKKVLQDEMGLLSLHPAKPGASLVEIARWCRDTGYSEHGLLIEGSPAVACIRSVPDALPLDQKMLNALAGLLGQAVANGTARFDYAASKRGAGDRLATSLTVSEIKRLRRRNPYDSRDLAFIEQPTLEQIEKLYGVSL